ARTSEKEVELVAAMLDRLLREGNTSLLQKVYLTYTKPENRETKLTFSDAAGKEAAGSPVFIKTLLTRELKQALGLPEGGQLPFSVEVVGEGSVTEDGKYHVLKVIFGPEVLNGGRLDAVNKALRQTQ